MGLHRLQGQQVFSTPPADLLWVVRSVLIARTNKKARRKTVTDQDGGAPSVARHEPVFKDIKMPKKPFSKILNLCGLGECTLTKSLAPVAPTKGQQHGPATKDKSMQVLKILTVPSPRDPAMTLLGKP